MISPAIELARLDQRLAEHHLEGHWALTGRLGTAPRPVASPHVWPWAEVRELVVEAGRLSIAEAAARRTIRLCTPGIAEQATTPTIHASIQMVKPGEVAEAHRHTIAAFRFVIEGRGGYTTVEGERFEMEPGDLVLTPQWTWHDHGHDGGEDVMWIDCHDQPFVRRLNGLFFESFAQPRQEIVHRAGYGAERAGAMRPQGVAPRASGTPYVYKGAEARALLRRLERDAWDPHRGTTLEYVDPLTGGSTLPTIACRLSLLRAGEATRRYRRTPNEIFHVLEGHGTTVAGDETLTWAPGDIFVVPSWTWHAHRAGDGGDAILFAASDDPIYRTFSLERCEDAEEPA